MALAFVFAISLPVGAVAGISINSGIGESHQNTATGSLNAIAAGSLLYIGIVEMIAEEFEDHHLLKSRSLKFSMFVALILGCSLMSLLALWA